MSGKLQCRYFRRDTTNSSSSDTPIRLGLKLLLLKAEGDGYLAFSVCPSFTEASPAQFLYKERRDAGLFVDRLDRFRQKRRNTQNLDVLQFRCFCIQRNCVRDNDLLNS